MKKLSYFIFILLVSFLGIIVCVFEYQGNQQTDYKNTVLNCEQYVKWTESNDNDLRVTRVMNGFDFSLQYLPASYMLSKQVVRNQGSGESLTVGDYDGIHFFNFRIKKESGTGEVLRNDLGSLEEYKSRVEYYAFDFKDDVFLVQGNDTVYCEMSHFERAYDATPFCNIMIGFPSKEIKDDEDCTIVVHEKIFDRGILKFRFMKNTFNSIPKLATL